MVIGCEPYCAPLQLDEFDTLELAVAEMDRLNANPIHGVDHYEVVVWRE